MPLEKERLSSISAMALSRLNRKGFLLSDGLLCVVIAVMICKVCFDSYYLFLKHEEGRSAYHERLMEKLEAIYAEMVKCEPCVIEDEQSQTDTLSTDRS